MVKEYLSAEGIDCPNSAPDLMPGGDVLFCEDEHDITIYAYYSRDDAESLLGVDDRLSSAIDQDLYAIYDDLWLITAEEEETALDIYYALDEAGQPATSANNAPSR